MKHLGDCSRKGESKLLVNFDSVMEKCRYSFEIKEERSYMRVRRVYI